MNRKATHHQHHHQQHRAAYCVFRVYATLLAMFLLWISFQVMVVTRFHLLNEKNGDLIGAPSKTREGTIESSIPPPTPHFDHQKPHHHQQQSPGDNLFVTILLDNLGSCPDKCAFVHKMLPPWTKFRYASFSNYPNDLAPVEMGLGSSTNNNNDTATRSLQIGDRIIFQENGKEWSNGEVANITSENALVALKDFESQPRIIARDKVCKKTSQNACRKTPFHVSLNHAAVAAAQRFDSSPDKPLHHHILVLTRRHVEEIAQWTKWYKLQSQKKKGGELSVTTSVGLFLMADEKLQQHKMLYHTGLYQSTFDYILRNYWFSPHTFPLPLQALGNQTCGTPTTTAAGNASSMAPKHGIHWVMLQPHEHHVLLDRNPTDLWPTALRHHNCSFTGWAGLGLGHANRKSLRETALLPQYSSLGCNVQLQWGFNGGSSKFDYLSTLADSKIGFNPRGVHPECHRLPELLSSGTVPAMTHEEYMEYVPLQSRFPGIVGRNWTEVMDQAQAYLTSQDGLRRLDRMARDGMQWWKDVQHCMQSDMEKILEQVMNDYNH